MPIFILSILIQVTLIVHILKTGRNTIWIWIVLGIPVAGSIAYFIVEILPTFLNSHKGQKAKKDIFKILNPNKDFNNAMQNYSITDTVKNSLDLAEECMNKQMFKEAQQLFTKSLSGEYKYEPQIMLGLAQAEFALGNYETVKQLLNQLIEKNSNYEDSNTHLLYARTEEALNDFTSAKQVYEALESYNSDPEILFRHAMVLKYLGELEASKNKLTQIIRIANISGKHHKNLFKTWIINAKRELKQL